MHDSRVVNLKKVKTQSPLDYNSMEINTFKVLLKTQQDQLVKRDQGICNTEYNINFIFINKKYYINNLKCRILYVSIFNKLNIYLFMADKAFLQAMVKESL